MPPGKLRASVINDMQSVVAQAIGRSLLPRWV